VVTLDGALRPEDEALLADSVGLALLVVLDTLSPAERLAFVLHDMFDLPFEEIARWSAGRPPPPGSWPAGAAGGSRGRSRRLRIRISRGSVRWSTPSSAPPAAVSSTRWSGLLHPDVVLRADFGGRRPNAPRVVRGAEAVAGQAQLAAMPRRRAAPGAGQRRGRRGRRRARPSVRGDGLRRGGRQDRRHRRHRRPGPVRRVAAAALDG
jgi:RNA polymerase sigma-70 factor (ECF subfamily)